MRDRYYCGYITYQGVEYKGRHEPLISEALFFRVQNVLYGERKAGNRERTHNHYLKGVVFCDRCHRRLMIMRGKSKSGVLYFYYICRGREDHTCDLPYLKVADVETAVLQHYAHIQIPKDLQTLLVTKMDKAATDGRTTTKQLHTQLTKRLRLLDTQEDRFLDLVGDPDWPKEKTPPGCVPSAKRGSPSRTGLMRAKASWRSAVRCS